MLLNRLLNFRGVVATAHFVNYFPKISTKFYSISSNTMEQENQTAIAGELTRSADDDINSNTQFANEKFMAATALGESNISTEDDANSNKQSANEDVRLGQLKHPAESKFNDYVKLDTKAFSINWPNGRKQRLEVWMGKERTGHKFIKIVNKNLFDTINAYFPNIPVPEDAYSIVQAMDELLIWLNSNQKIFNLHSENTRSKKIKSKRFKFEYNFKAVWLTDNQFCFQMELIYPYNQKKIMNFPINTLPWLRNVFAEFLQRHDGSQKLNEMPNYPQPQELKQRYLFRQASSPNAFLQRSQQQSQNRQPSQNLQPKPMNQQLGQQTEERQASSLNAFLQRSQQQSQNRHPSQILQPKPMNQQSGQQKEEDYQQQQHLLQALNQIAQRQDQLGDVHSKLAMTQQQISAMYNCIMQMQNSMTYQQASNQFGQQIQYPQQSLQPVTQQPQSQPYVDNTNQALISLISQLITQQGQQQEQKIEQRQSSPPKVIEQRQFSPPKVIEQRQFSPPKVFYDFNRGQQKPKYKSQRVQFPQYQRPLQRGFTFFEEEKKEKAKTTTNLEEDKEKPKIESLEDMFFEEDKEKPKIESLGDMFLDGRLEAADK